MIVVAVHLGPMQLAACDLQPVRPLFDVGAHPGELHGHGMQPVRLLVPDVLGIEDGGLSFCQRSQNGNGWNQVRRPAGIHIHSLELAAPYPEVALLPVPGYLCPHPSQDIDDRRVSLPGGQHSLYRHLASCHSCRSHGIRGGGEVARNGVALQAEALIARHQEFLLTGLNSYPRLGQHIQGHFRIRPGLQLSLDHNPGLLLRQRSRDEQGGEELGADATIQAGRATLHPSPHHQRGFSVVADGEGLGPEVAEAAQERPIGPAADGGIAGENRTLGESCHRRAEAQSGSGVEDIDHILRGSGPVCHALDLHILIDIDLRPKGLAGGDGSPGVSR